MRALTSTCEASPDGEPYPPDAFMVKPSADSEGIAQTGLTCVRIAFESALSMEIAWRGLVAEPLRSIHRPSHPVVEAPEEPENQMSELSKCDNE